VVDVYGENERYPDTIASTKMLEAGLLNPVLFRSREINHVIDNFADSSSQNQQVEIRVKNEGDTIPQAQLKVFFQGMVSRRSVKTTTPHLGIGLYVSQKIAKFHQRQLQIANRRDKQGVEVVLLLPIAT